MKINLTDGGGLPHSRRYESVQCYGQIRRNHVASNRPRSCSLPISGKRTLSAGEDDLGLQVNHLSIPYLNGAIELQGLTVYEKTVLILLANRADAKGYCWPSIKRLSLEGCMSRHSVMRAVKSLESKNIISVIRKHRVANGYMLNGGVLLLATKVVANSNKPSSRQRPQPSVITTKEPDSFRWEMSVKTQSEWERMKETL